MNRSERKVVNCNQRKLDGPALVSGRPVYTADLRLEGMLYGKILHSPHAHARIVDIDISEAKALPGVHAVLTSRDIPRILYTTAGQGAPEPSPKDSYVLDNKVRFVGDSVAAVAAETEELAEKALRSIRVEWEILPAVLDVELATAEGSARVHEEASANGISQPERNVAASVEVTDGDPDRGFAEADFVVEGCYQLGYVHTIPMEPHVCIAYLDEHRRLVVITSTQVPFHVRRIIAPLVGLPVQKIRVIKPRIGGGFGCKQEILLEPLCALLALRSRRPVKVEFSHREVFTSTRTRHPQKIWVKTGLKKGGTILANEMRVLANTGAYGSHALTVQCNTGSKTLPLYRTAEYEDGVYNVRFQADAVYTNLPVAGAFRGYGATQGFFALESHMDECAATLGMDPITFRLRNMIREGDRPALLKRLGEGRPGYEQVIRSCGLKNCIELGKKEIGWDEKRGKRGEGPIKRGVGMAILQQGSGIAGVDMGSVSIKLNEDGSFNLLAGATDLGTGSDTILAQIAAEVLETSPDKFEVYSSDTDFTPFDTGAYASSTTYISGMAAKKAAEKVREMIVARAALLLQAREKDVRLSEGRAWVGSKSISYGEICSHALYEEDQHQIMAIASHISYDCPPPFSAHFAEVTVDTETGRVKVIKYVAAVDCGLPINPQQAEGQTEGGIQMGLGYALTEELVVDEKGRIINPSLFDYKIFSAADMPEMVTILVPTPEPTGPFGAKSVAEIPINGPAPAVANAVFDAVGVRIKSLPITPEKVLRALQCSNH